MWKGTISVSEEELPILEALGVRIFDYDGYKQEARVSLSHSVYKKLDPYWGQFSWNLRQFKSKIKK